MPKSARRGRSPLRVSLPGSETAALDSRASPAAAALAARAANLGGRREELDATARVDLGLDEVQFRSGSFQPGRGRAARRPAGALAASHPLILRRAGSRG